MQRAEQHAGGVFPHGIAVAFWAAVHRHATTRCGVQIDVFKPRATSCHPGQIRQGVEHLGVQSDAAAQHQPVDGRRFGGGVVQEFVSRHGRPVVTHHARFCQRLLKRGVHSVQEPNMHGVHFTKTG